MDLRRIIGRVILGVGILGTLGYIALNPSGNANLNKLNKFLNRNVSPCPTCEVSPAEETTENIGSTQEISLLIKYPDNYFVDGNFVHSGRDYGYAILELGLADNVLNDVDPINGMPWGNLQDRLRIKKLLVHGNYFGGLFGKVENGVEKARKSAREIYEICPGYFQSELSDIVVRGLFNSGRLVLLSREEMASIIGK